MLPIEREKQLKRLFWDMSVDIHQVIGIIDGKSDGDETIRPENVYYRLLTTYDWYTLLKIVPPASLGRMLDDDVIGKIKPKSLADKYRYARRLLHE